MNDKLSERVLSRYLSGRTFPNEKSLERYLKEHPHADKSKHKVVDKDDETTRLMKEQEKKHPGSINWNYDPTKNKGQPIKDETDEERDERVKKIRERQK